MNAADRNKRNARVARLFRQGTPQTVIGKRFGLHASRVHSILQAAGLLPEPTRIEHQTTTFWDAAEDRRRQIFWKRQREGARKALAEFDA